jgi:hypothetical protein
VVKVEATGGNVALPATGGILAAVHFLDCVYEVAALAVSSLPLPCEGFRARLAALSLSRLVLIAVVVLLLITRVS